MSWRKFPVSLSELCLDTTLRCGQSFRWRKSDENIWSCALAGRLFSLRQDATHVHYRAISPNTAKNVPLSPPPSAPASVKQETPVGEDDGLETELFIKHYLNLEPNLTELYEQWSQADLNFKKKAPRFTGVRILRQDAWETLVGFICSSNNNIIRISQMMEKLCVHYGSLIGHIEQTPFHDMPSPKGLIEPCVEEHLRSLGFGYRAKYLHITAKMIVEKGDGWLDNLRNPEKPLFGKKALSAGEMLPNGRKGYREAHEALLELQGVGPKVADCICLMGLGWGEAVPVDTHVWQIAQRDYKFGKGKHRSLTKATYDAIGDHFRELWLKEAGWAHSVLFAADLRTFSEKLVVKTETETTLKGEELLAVKLEEIVKDEDGAEMKLKVEVREDDSDFDVKVEREGEVMSLPSARSRRQNKRSRARDDSAWEKVDEIVVEAEKENNVSHDLTQRKPTKTQRGKRARRS
ncbi:8-oxoguanine glycosylase ogg1 [Agyrium rufum]|nr:8-oxoguanine glycosylase ogg1 [Agyrium rufum]